MTQPKVNQPNLVQYVTLAVMVLFFVGSLTYMRPADPIVPQEIDESELIQRITNGVVSGVVIPTATGNISVDNSKIDEIYAEIFKDDVKESIAEEVALDEIETDDFLEEVLDVLNDDGGSVEDYEDIEVYSSKIEETSVSGDEATVEVTVKVKYINDGDEEDNERARLYAVFDVEDLEEDDEYEDAEASLESLTLEKIYD